MTKKIFLNIENGGEVEKVENGIGVCCICRIFSCYAVAMQLLCSLQMKFSCMCFSFTRILHLFPSHGYCNIEHHSIVECIEILDNDMLHTVPNNTRELCTTF